MKKILSLVALMVLSVSIFGQNLKSDAQHSRIQFVVTHLGLNEITGNFNSAALSISRNAKDFTKSTLKFSAETASVNTNVEARDTHLRSADFLDAATYPEMSFVSTSIAPTKNKNVFVLKGSLTMHGTTQPVTMNLIYKGTTVNPMSKKQTYAYQVLGALKRSAYGIGGKFLENVVSDIVQVKGDFELTVE